MRSGRGVKTAYDIVREADVAQARTLAQEGFVAMAREILARYPAEELPQCVVEVSVTTPRRVGLALRANALPRRR